MHSSHTETRTVFKIVIAPERINIWDLNLINRSRITVNMDSELKQSEEILPRKFGRRAILILIGLVMHFHGVYGLLAVVNDYVLPVAVSMSVAVVSISIMSFEDTLGNILAFETADAPGESRRHGFCCGAFDNDLIYFCGYPCHARLCCHRRVYFARLFYYNLNAFLVAAAWFGLDVNRAIVTERIVGSDLIGRIWMDIFYLFLSNVVLMYNHELMGQFGVVGDKAVLQFHDEPAPESVDADPDLSYSPMADTIPISPSERITKSASRESLGALNLSSTLEANLLNYSEAKPGLLLSAWNRYSKRLKIIIVFLALTMFWTATWDLLCSIPSQEMVGTEGDDGDDDYYDVHVKGRSDEEFLLLIWGLAYSVVAIVFMIITGELFSVVKRQDSTSEKVSFALLNCTFTVLTALHDLDSPIF